MEPVRIRLYGLFSVTRRSYLIQLGIAVVLLCLLASVQFLVPKLPPPPAGKEEPAQLARIVWLLNNTFWIALGLGLLFALEAFVVLRRFAREEALQREREFQSALAGPPQDPPPSATGT
jgi:hypothetical protein